MIRIAGIIPFTTIDFPENLATVIFCQGCPFRCPFCHNPELQKGTEGSSYSWESVCDFLTERRKKLDGVVFSGGEPLIQQNIEQAIVTVKNMGYKVAVHTNGFYPEKLKKILPLLDWIGMDIKAPWEKYDLLTGIKNSAPPVQRSLQYLLESNIDFEIRTTCDPRYLDIKDILEIEQDLHAAGVKNYVLQQYRTFDGDVNPPAPSDIAQLISDTTVLETGKSLFNRFFVRK